MEGLEEYTNEELINELVKRTTFKGMIITFRDGFRTNDRTVNTVIVVCSQDEDKKSALEMLDSAKELMRML